MALLNAMTATIQPYVLQRPQDNVGTELGVLHERALNLDCAVKERTNVDRICILCIAMYTSL